MTIKKSNLGRFWCFWPAVYNTVVTLELPRWCSWLHWSLLTPFMRLVRHGSPYGVLEARYKNSCCNHGGVHSCAAANTFYRPQKIFSSLLNTPHSFIWLEGHLRPIYLKQMTKIEPVLIYLSQFWYISVTLWWSTLVSHAFIEDMHLVDSPPHHCTTNSTQRLVQSSNFCRN